jgi:hypothetical protein
MTMPVRSVRVRAGIVEHPYIVTNTGPHGRGRPAPALWNFRNV